MAALTYISVFSGAGGLDLGLRIACPHARALGYVEIDREAAEVLVARIREGSLDDAPIWSDVRTFPGRLYRRRVAGILAGFPCPDYSVAGKRAGIIGKHGQLWDDLARLIRDVEPEWVLLENVSGILISHGGEDGSGTLPAGLWFVLADLAGLGFDAEWISIRASDIGASHGRNRWFCLAYVADAGDGLVSLARSGPDRRAGARPGGSELAHTGCATGGRLAIFAPGPDDPIWESVLVRDYLLRPALSQAEIEPHLCELADGMARLLDSSRTDSLRAAGNGVVPQQFAAVVSELARRASSA